MKTKLLKERNFEILFYLILFGLTFAWGIIQPFGDPPDEICRYLIPYYMFEHGALPNGTNPEVMVGIYGVSYAFLPGLPYIFMAVVMKIVSIFTMHPYILLMAARTVNMVAGVIAVYFVRKISKKVCVNPWYAWFFTIFYAFWPQAFFMRTYVNTDSFALMSIAIIFYGLLLGREEGWTKKAYITLAVGVSICGLSYYNAYGMILGAVITFVTTYLTYKDKKLHFDWKNALKIGGIITAIVFVLIGWWFIRSFVLYDGDILGFESNRKLSEIHAIDAYKASQRVTIQNSGKPISFLFTDGNYTNILTLSSIGIFGFMHIVSPVFVFRIFKTILLIGLIGLVLGKKKKFVENPSAIGFHVGMFLAIIIPFALCIVYSYTTDYQPQGRYLLPGLLPLLYFIVMGIQGMFERFLPWKWAKRFLLLVFISLILIAFFTDFEIIYRMYLHRWDEIISMSFTGGPLK